MTDWNRRHKAIFVHIPKTAGTSLLSALGAETVFDTHAPALAYRRLEPELYERSFTFAIVRDPWDRFASSFHFMKSGTAWPMQQQWAARVIGDLDFTTFVRKLRQPMFRQTVLAERFFWPQSFWISDRSDQVIVDRVYRFEELDAALADIGRRLGLAGDAEAPRHRQMARPSSASLYQDSEMIELVGDLYAHDVKRLGYCAPVVG